MTPPPLIRDVGLTGLLITFAPTLSEAANRAALTFRAAVDAAGWEGVAETTTSLTSTFLRYDPLSVDRDHLAGRVETLLEDRDWTEAPWPDGRLRWRIPVALGGAEGPAFDELAEAAGLRPDQAAEALAEAEVRVLTLGFAPGQGYLGELPKQWHVPRLTGITPRVPQGALVTAIRQLIIFAQPAPTGWRHIGQTAFRSYLPGTERPFPLAPGDLVRFEPVPTKDLPALWQDPLGGARSEAVA